MLEISSIGGNLQCRKLSVQCEGHYREISLPMGLPIKASFVSILLCNELFWISVSRQPEYAFPVSFDAFRLHRFDTIGDKNPKANVIMVRSI